MRFHTTGAAHCENLALAVFNSQRWSLLSCNDNFLDLVEYPLQQVEAGFTITDLYRNIASVRVSSAICVLCSCQQL
jgi:transposase-like protein